MILTGITAANGPTSAPAPADSPEAPSSLPDIPSAGNIYRLNLCGEREGE